MFLVVTGGSGSGKSAYAETRAVAMGQNRFYIATMECFDTESRERVKRHRAMRAGKGFTTVERYLALSDLVLPKSDSSVALLECMSNLTANEMFDPAGSHEQAYEEICAGITNLLDRCGHLVVVTNEIFSDCGGYDPSTEAYRRLLGRVNGFMADRADEVVEVVYGIPLRIK